MMAYPEGVQLKFFWGAGLVTSSKPPPPYEQLLPLPTPVLRGFWKDPLMTPTLTTPLQASFTVTPGIFSGRQNLLSCKFLLLCYCCQTKFQEGENYLKGAPSCLPVEESQPLPIHHPFLPPHKNFDHTEAGTLRTKTDAFSSNASW